MHTPLPRTNCHRRNFKLEIRIVFQELLPRAVETAISALSLMITSDDLFSNVAVRPVVCGAKPSNTNIADVHCESL